MKLHCPKCGMRQQVDLARAVETKYRGTCRSCAATIIVKGAIKGQLAFLGHTVYCSQCGCELPYADSCPSCKVAFTGYMLVLQELSLPAGISPVPGQMASLSRPGFQLVRRIAVRVRFIPRKVLVSVGIIAIVLSLLLGLKMQYRQRNVERKFLTNSVMALYCIKSGFDRGSAIGSNYVTDGRRNQSLGISISDPANEELADLETVNGEVERLMQKLKDTPESLRDVGNRLVQLHTVYERQNLLVRKPHGSIAVYDLALLSTQADFLRTMDEFKTAMPPQLREEVKKAGMKYNLRFLE